MTADFSTDFITNAFQEQTDEVYLVLMTLSHADLLETIHVVNNTEPIVSSGVQYLACPFGLKLPSSTDDGPPAAQVRIDNVSQDVIKSLRLVSDGIAVRMSVIAASNPDQVEADYPGFMLNRVKADVQVVTGSLGLDDLRLEPFPAHSFTPGLFSGLFP